MGDHYKELGVAVGATSDEIRRAYRAIALQDHPDKTLSLSADERTTREASFKRATGAYEVLSDKDKRSAYDAKTYRNPPRSSKGNYYDFGRDGREARRAEAMRQREQRREKKQKERNEREEQWERREREDRAREASRQGHEDTRHVTHPSLMGESMERVFGLWKYEIRLSTLFKLRETTEPTESSADLATELAIALKLDAVPQTRDALDTEDVYVKIANAPGLVERFETYLKERCDGSCTLTIMLRATPNTYYSVFPLELPIDLRLNTNWVPFGSLLDAAARATYLRFYSEAVEMPEDRDLSDYEDEELRGRETVDLMGETRRNVRLGLSKWKRVARMGFTRKWW
ncbi:DnaJ-domain-containing protein [Ophiobolus disseminans]|uniref:DnaJ-domain-containing protein n=1 Tax=Ophiobolus disseminans TaxID=1469910 RepID=A0A6A7AMX7_9PLEO|nr:DnaJ-domain-containing protein [Ophiobolus disseminans]